jgi:iron(II)-dependent oxidoreductase
MILAGIGLVSAGSVVLGWLSAYPPAVAGGGTGLGYVLLQWALGNWRPRRKPVQPAAPPPKPEVNLPPEPEDPNDINALVKRMLVQGRYALLLRPQVAANTSDKQLARAREALESQMALVPDGEVVVGRIDDALDDGELDDDEIAACEGRVIRVDRFFLDRYPVTNRQFHQFVASGGYEQIALWEESIWPAVLDFVDQTGEPGPLFWRDGCYEPGKADHPVVGVSWYEAAAYAQWLGKRLPSDAEWVKAGSWPVALSASTRVQRRYPWGDTMDRKRANLWGSSSDGTASIDQFPEGVSVGGVYQLIGNVWEWTRGSFLPQDFPHRDLVMDVPLKSIRGGAYDTYLDNQATCQFQSGEPPIARKPNVGFRCAVGVCDLMLTRSTRDHAATVEFDPVAAEEAQV